MKIKCNRCEKTVDIKLDIIKSTDNRKMYKAKCSICKNYIKFLSNKEKDEYFRLHKIERVRRSDSDYFDRFK